MDTAALVAFYNFDDEKHLRSTELFREIGDNNMGTLIISDYIFDETINLLKRYLGNRKTTAIGDYLLKEIELKRIELPVFLLSWELSKKFDKLSFTDCSNIALMKHYNIDYLATFDSGFDGIVKVLR